MNDYTGIKKQNYSPSCPACGTPDNSSAGGGYTTGIPTGPQYGQLPLTGQPRQQAQTASGTSSVTPQTMMMESTQFLNGYLRTQIGKKVTVSFLIGTNTFVDKTGTLLAVGINYILINEADTDDLLICDFYTIKFIKVYY